MRKNNMVLIVQQVQAQAGAQALAALTALLGGGAAAAAAAVPAPVLPPTPPAPVPVRDDVPGDSMIFRSSGFVAKKAFWHGRGDEKMREGIQVVAAVWRAPLLPAAEAGSTNSLINTRALSSSLDWRARARAASIVSGGSNRKAGRPGRARKACLAAPRMEALVLRF